MNNDALIVGTGMILGAMVAGIIALVLIVGGIKYRDTSTRHGECVVQERVCEPAFRLVCPNDK